MGPVDISTRHVAKENAPIGSEQATPAPIEAEAAPAPATATEGGDGPALPTDAHDAHDEEAHKKPKSPGVLER